MSFMGDQQMMDIANAIKKANENKQTDLSFVSDQQPMEPEAAATALANEFIKRWMSDKTIVDPGARWQALRNFDLIVCWILNDPEVFFAEYCRLI